MELFFSLGALYTSLIDMADDSRRTSVYTPMVCKGDHIMEVSDVCRWDWGLAY